MTSDKHIPELTELTSHFAFGENWRGFAESIDRDRIEIAANELVSLVGRTSFTGEKWIDIGCGSGLHAVAAASLGAHVLAIDIDPTSVRTTARIAERFGLADRVVTRVESVFGLEENEQEFDVVYSWGVLHHTGNMNRAIRVASSLVANNPSAQLVLALYRKTWLCALWRLEKKWYTSASPRAQRTTQATFNIFYGVSFLARGRSFRNFRANYRSRRGMDYQTDIHDWLGGFPYESVVPEQLIAQLQNLGLRAEKTRLRYPGRTPSGLFGSGCDEYVFRWSEASS